MAQSSTGYVWDLPNYTGELFTADAVSSPFLSLLKNKEILYATNFEFPIKSEYDFAAASQPAITEAQSLTASSFANMAVTTQTKNVCQTFEKYIIITYEKLAARGRLLGINTIGQSLDSLKQDEYNFQLNYNLKQIGRELEVSLLEGSYQIATDENVANKMRGIAECASNASNTVAAESTDLTKDHLDELLRTMYGNGAPMKDLYLFGTAIQIQRLNNEYENGPMSRTEGGVNIQSILTPFGLVKLVMTRQIATAANVYVADISECNLVYQTIPQKGNLFAEPLGKSGAADSWMLYGKVGLNHGAIVAHGSITGLKTS